MPQTLKGTIFTEIIPQLIPEINFGNCVKLGALVKHRNRLEIYEPLIASLRKIQWVKFAGVKAMTIEMDIKEQMKPGTVLIDPIGQIDHALSTTDVLVHTKSALDSMAVFLTDLLCLGAKKSHRDFKLSEFRKQVARKDLMLGRVTKKLHPWFQYLQEVRDEWIHRTAVRPFIVIGPSEVGILPIPKKTSFAGKLFPASIPIKSDNLWSTVDFFSYHYFKLATLFNAIVERAIKIEENNLTSQPPVPEEEETRIIVFPFRVTKPMKAKQVKISVVKLSAYYERLGKLLE
jgi:hypothetical protein